MLFFPIFLTTVAAASVALAGTAASRARFHDNNGESDQHLTPGREIFDFSGLFTFLRTNNRHPLITLEPHNREDLWQALAYMEETGLHRYLNILPP